MFGELTVQHERPTRPPVPLTLKPPAPPRRYLGLGVSLVLHGLVLALLVTRGERLWSRTLAPGFPAPGAAADGGSGGGGSRVAYITLPPMPKTEPPPRPKVVKVVPPPRQVQVPVRAPEQPEAVTPPPQDTVAPPTHQTLATADSGAARGTAPGTGTGGQPGQGNGSSAGGGNGFGPGGEGGRARPPEPRDMAFPFDNPPKELRGTSLNVTFWVRNDGRVERYVVEPAIKDRDYAKKFDEVMRAFRFTPAQAADGTRIPGTTRISFTLPGKSSS
ncbi:MAG TPA: hypothetical protein VE399_05850 [Gemmatimonadales bacterium]|nr:hypothetical protein [Gemmatimonadales bacterium]